MKIESCDLSRYVEQGPRVRGPLFYAVRRIAISRSARAFAGGLAAGIVSTLCGVLMFALLNP